MLNRQTCKGILCVSPSLITRGVFGIATSLLALWSDPFGFCFFLFMWSFAYEYTRKSGIIYPIEPCPCLPRMASQHGVGPLPPPVATTTAEQRQGPPAGRRMHAGQGRQHRPSCRRRSISERSSSRLKTAVRVHPGHRKAGPSISPLSAGCSATREMLMQALQQALQPAPRQLASCSSADRRYQPQDRLCPQHIWACPALCCQTCHRTCPSIHLACPASYVPQRTYWIQDQDN